MLDYSSQFSSSIIVDSLIDTLCLARVPPVKIFPPNIVPNVSTRRFSNSEHCSPISSRLFNVEVHTLPTLESTNRGLRADFTRAIRAAPDCNSSRPGMTYISGSIRLWSAGRPGLAVHSAAKFYDTELDLENGAAEDVVTFAPHWRDKRNRGPKGLRFMVPMVPTFNCPLISVHVSPSYDY